MEDKIKSKNGKLVKTNKKEKMEKLHKKDKKVSALRLYCHYISIHVRSTMQYKTSFFLTTLGQFLFSFNVFVGITFMFQRFHEVKGFTYSEVLIIGFSLLNCLEFFVFRKMKSSSTINHPLCGCESNVIQKKLPFRVQ